MSNDTHYTDATCNMISSRNIQNCSFGATYKISLLNYYDCHNRRQHKINLLDGLK